MPKLTDSPLLDERYVDAFRFAFDAHRRQLRKTSPAPYIAHLASVSALVLEHRGTQDQAIAGLLHDVLEDTPTTLDEVRSRFGTNVARMVVDCTDPVRDKSASWEERKRAKLARIPRMWKPSLLVYACDKLHNLRQMSEDMVDYGPSMWGETGGGFAGTAAFYTEYVKVLTALMDDEYRSLFGELNSSLDEVKSVGESIGLSL